MYIDYNGNGRIDPVDIGVSIAVEDEMNDVQEEERTQKEKNRLDLTFLKQFFS